MLDHRNQQRRVTFAAHDTVVEIIHINDMPEDEINDVYMSREELNSIRKECKTYVRMIEEGLHEQNGKELFCTRGLEHHTRACTSVADEIRESQYDAVYAVQSFQEASGQDVAEMIAHMCGRLSAISLEYALATAKADATWVKRQAKSAASSRKRKSQMYKKSQTMPAVFSPKSVISRHLPLGESLFNTGATTAINIDDIVDQAVDTIMMVDY